jgi:hypothetical protein
MVEDLTTTKFTVDLVMVLKSQMISAVTPVKTSVMPIGKKGGHSPI